MGKAINVSEVGVCGQDYYVARGDRTTGIKECPLKNWIIHLDAKNALWEAKGCLFHYDPEIEIGRDEVPQGVTIDDIRSYKNSHLKKVIPNFLAVKSAETLLEIGSAAYPLWNLDLSGKDVMERLILTSIQRKNLVLHNSRLEMPVWISDSSIDSVYAENVALNSIVLENSHIRHIRLNRCSISGISLQNSTIELLEVDSMIHSLNSTKSKVLTFDFGDYRGGRGNVSYSFPPSSLATNMSELERTKPGVEGKVNVERSYMHIKGGDFSEAEIKETDQIEFSYSKVKGAHITASNPDSWRKLKIRYNTNSSVLAIIFLFAFFLPFAFEFFQLRVLGILRTAVSGVSPSGGISAELPSICFGVDCKEVRAVPFIWNSLGGFYQILTACLLVLNLIRVYLVGQVAIVREWEEQSGVYPNRGVFFPVRFSGWGFELIKDWSVSYGRLVILDKAVKLLAFAAYVSFALAIFSVWQEFILVPDSD